jgi:hypothetical protein
MRTTPIPELFANVRVLSGQQNSRATVPPPAIFYSFYGDSVLARGAGSASRFDIGLVIATGMLIGTLFTRFVVPVMYTLLAAS